MNQQAAKAGLAGDLWGGLASMLVALPSSIAFGVLVYGAIGPEYAGQGALAGIIGAAVLGIVAPLISRNGGFITAPCAPAAAVLAALAVELAAKGGQSPGRITALLALTGLLAALLQLLYGLLRSGGLIKFIPYQVVTGYLSGVALLIALGQLPRLLGLPKGTTLVQGLASPELWNGYGVAVGLATMAVLFAAPRLTQRVPAPILGLAAGIAAYFALALFQPGLLRLEENPLIIGPLQASGTLLDAAGARADQLLGLRAADLGLVLVAALTLSVLLSIDTLKTGVVLDALTRRRHNSNRELLGQGAANAAACLAGGMPGAGTMGATLVNVTSGGRSPRSGIAEGCFVIAAYALLGSLIAWVPIAALAGVLLAVAWRMFDRDMFRLAAHRGTRLDFAVIAAVVIVAQFDLVAASAVGIALAMLLFIRDQIRGSVIVSLVDLRAVRSKRRRLAADNECIQAHGGEAAVVQLHGNLFFGTADQLFTQLEGRLGTLRYLLVDLRRVDTMDFTAAHLIEQMRARLVERGGDLLFSGMPSSLPMHAQIEGYLSELGLVRRDSGVRVFDTRDAALEWMEDRLLQAAGRRTEEEDAPLALGAIEIFNGLDPASLAALQAVMLKWSVAAGARVFSRGDAGDEIFFVRRGRVHALLPLEAGQRHHLATFCSGDFFGEIAFLDRAERSADVEAHTATDLYVLSRARFDELARSDPKIAGLMFERLSFALAQRLRTADAELRVLEER